MNQKNKGTGKTIAYLLPLIQRVIEKIKTENKPDLQEEVGRFAKKIKKDNLNRTNRRPRLIILVPNRELAHQVYHIVKIITSTELNTAILLGGPDRDKQSVALRKQSPDIIIGTPARILHHNSEGWTFPSLSLIHHFIAHIKQTGFISLKLKDWW